MKLAEIPWVMIALTITAILCLTVFSAYQERQITKRTVETACVETTGNPDCYDPDPEQIAHERRIREYEYCHSYNNAEDDDHCEQILFPEGVTDVTPR